MVTPEATPISNPAQQRAGQRAEAADDDGDEARHDEIVADRRLQAQHADGQHAGEAREIDAETEIQVAQDAHIDAEHRDGLEIERAGADAQCRAACSSGSGTARPPPAVDQQHHEHAVAGEEEEFAAERRSTANPGSENGRLCAPQMKRVPSSIMKARPKVSSRL